MDEFCILRFRLGIEPIWTKAAKTITLWDKSPLDIIENPLEENIEENELKKRRG